MKSFRYFSAHRGVSVYDMYPSSKISICPSSCEQDSVGGATDDRRSSCVSEGCTLGLVIRDAIENCWL